MLSTISEEGLSPQAKALLRLLKWAEKEGAACKELHKDNGTYTVSKNGREYKDNTRYSKRENPGTSEFTTHTKAGI